MGKHLKFFAILAVFLLATSAFAADVVHQVAAGNDGISQAYASADSADIIELITSGGEYIETDSLVIENGKPITICAAAGLEAKPIWTTKNTARNLEINDTVYLQGIIMTGIVDDGIADANDSTNSAIRVGIDPAPGLSIYAEDVDFKDYVFFEDGEDQSYVVRYDDAAIAGGDLQFVNCTFTNIQKYAFRFRGAVVAPGAFSNINFENCTSWDIGSYFLRATVVDTTGSGLQPMNISVEHCTFDNITDACFRLDSDYGLASFTSNIFSAIGGAVLDIDTMAVNFTDNDVVSSGDMSIGATSIYVENNILDVDPSFVNATEGDFTVSAFGAELLRDGAGLIMGHLIWDPQYQTDGYLSVTAPSTNGFSSAYGYGFSDILFTTAGGKYIEENKTKIKRPVSILGSDPDDLAVLVAHDPDRPFNPQSDFMYFSLENLKITGKDDDGVTDGLDSTKYAARVRDVTTNGWSLVCNNCVFEYFWRQEESGPEGYAFRFDDDAGEADSIVFRDCLFLNTGIYGLGFDNVSVKTYDKLIIEDCTFADILGPAINTDGPPLSDPSEVVLNHLTFANLRATVKAVDGVTDSTVYYDAIELNVDGITVENSIFANLGSVVTSNVANDVTISYCDLYETVGYGASVTPTEVNPYDLNPEFADEDAYDFTVSSFFESIAAGNDGWPVGDRRWVSGPFVSAAEIVSGLPTQFELGANYPNPFNAGTMIPYSLPQTANVQISIFNVLGQRVSTLVSGVQQAGYKKVFWNGTNASGMTVPSGIYFVRMQAADLNLTRRVMLVK